MEEILTVLFQQSAGLVVAVMVIAVLLVAVSLAVLLPLRDRWMGALG